MCFEEIETEIFKILENSQTTNMKHIFLKILYYQLIFIYFMSVISHFKILLFFYIVVELNVHNAEKL